jgi:hypothetical protein
MAKELTGLQKFLGPEIWNVYSPITDSQLNQIDPRCERIQFNEQLTDNDLARLSSFMLQKGIHHIRVFGHNTVDDLKILRFFNWVKKLSIDVWTIKSLQGIDNYCPHLEYLGVGNTKSKSHSLKFVSGLANLKELYLEGHKKDIEYLVSLNELERLTLRSITLPGLDFLKEIPSLWWLAIKLGGTSNISALTDSNLKYLELWRIRGFANLLPITKIPTLQFIFLETLAHIDLLPSLNNLSNLRKLSLRDLHNLSNIKSVLEAPNLEELEILGFNKVDTKEFLKLRGHPTLLRASIFVGREKQNAIIHENLKLPPAKWGKDDFPFIH